VNGNMELDLMGMEFDFSFPINNNPAYNVIRTQINRVEITGPTDILTIIYNLIFLKFEVKGLGNHAQNIYDFELTINKDISKQTDH